MTPALLLTTLLLFSAGGQSSRGPGKAKLSQAQAEFNRGNFDEALKLLSAAQAETNDDDTLAKVHLLRGQAYGAMRDLVQAEEALADALEHDPEATLDPNRVDPSLVTLMSGLKQRLRGSLEVVATDRPGSRVTFDGKLLGNTPVRAQVEIGRHRVEVRSSDGRYGAGKEVVIHPRRLERAELSLKELQDAPTNSGNASSGSSPVMFGFGKPMADIRLQFDPLQWAEGVGIEVGGGLQSQYLRGSLSFRVFPQFGLTARGAFAVPVMDKMRAYVELELPVIFYYGGVALGLGGAGGVDYEFNKWLSTFGQVGARHYFITPTDDNRLTLEAGVRLSLP